MRIDEEALEAAANALANVYQYNGANDECREQARRIIEAYEAAIWRPIKEAPDVRPNIMVWIPTPTDPWNPDGIMLHGRDVAYPDKGAMFRTITPPPSS